MSTTLNIINRALGEVNAPAISAVNDGSVYAEVANRSWKPARDAVLRAHPWPCCIRRSQLNRSEETPAWEFAHAHVLPVDYAVIVSVFPETTYAIESGLILSDQREMAIKYVSTDTKFYDAALEDAIVYELASRLAMPLSSKKSLAETLTAKAKNTLNRAIHTTARETTPKDIRTNKWKAVKMGNRRPR